MTTNVNSNKRVALALLSTTALLGSLSLSSCQDYEPFSEAEVHATMAAREFTNNFEQRYGKIDPNHDWGFGPIIGDVSDMTRGANPEKNLWESKYHLEIPGWPDIYTKKDGTVVNGGYHSARNGDNLDNGWSDSKPSPSNTIPAGDVTDEEIQYVSWYFRTHKVGREPIHLSDYFIQEISSDNDRDENGNVITQLPIYINDVQSGYENESTWGLEYLHAKNFEGNSESSQHLTGYTHINNFNHGASNNLSSQAYAYVGDNPNLSFTNNDKPKNETHHRMIQFYATAGTEDFMVKCSQETGSETATWHNDWALVHLVFDGPSGRHYDGYYLGFDYSCVKKDSMDPTKVTRYEKDGYYSNWIFKITAAEPEVNNPYSRRIMCEDLGNTLDFDFNDVVFDATYNLTSEELRNYKEGDEVDVTITVRASGGTLPIYIGNNSSDKYEAHYLLGKEDSNHNPVTSIPVNVGPKGQSGPIATYHVKQHSLDADDINIYVKSYDGEFYHINPVKKGNLDNYNNGQKGNSVAPQKFAVPIGVRWMQECEFIEEGYEFFKSWVNNREFLNNGKAWYDNANITDLSLLYANGESGVQNTNDNQSAVIDGESSDSGEYSEYGTNVRYEVDSTDPYNKKYFMPMSAFDSSKDYTLTIVVESTNPGWNQYTFQVRASNKVYVIDNGDSSNYAGTCSMTTISAEDKLYTTQTTLNVDKTQAPEGYDYFQICNLQGVASVKAILMKEVAN